ncbi:MAG: type IV pilus modification protein PilV [Methylococcales bacterium]
MQNEQGFTLVEVLVSVFVLAIGLLGLSGLQIAGLRNNHSAYLRTQASVLAYDMTDRMRANNVALQASSYNNQSNTNPYTACLTVSGCTPAQMAAHDLYEWSNAASPISVARMLPNGKGIVCIDHTPIDGSASSPACDGHGNTGGVGFTYAIKVWWTDDRSGNEKRFVTTVDFN